MKSILRNNLFSLILLGAILIGGIAGVILGPKASVLKPLGDLFLNLLFMIIVPLVFFSISSAIASMSGMKRLGKIMGSILLVFVITALVASVFGLIVALLMNPTQGVNYASLQSIIQQNQDSVDKVKQLGVLEQLVNTFTVSLQLVFWKTKLISDIMKWDFIPLNYKK